MKRNLSARGLPLAVDGGALVALESGISLVFHKEPPSKKDFWLSGDFFRNLRAVRHGKTNTV